MTKKKKVFIQIGRVFFPEFNCCRPTSSDSDADQSQIIGGQADVDLSQIIGGMQSNYGGDIRGIPRVLAPLVIIKGYVFTSTKQFTETSIFVGLGKSGFWLATKNVKKKLK